MIRWVTWVKLAGKQWYLEHKMPQFYFSSFKCLTTDMNRRILAEEIVASEDLLFLNFELTSSLP